jgi:preprotein translocase subunit YajC
MIFTTTCAVLVLVFSVVATMVLLDIVHRRRARRLIEGHVPGLKPGDRVLTHFGFEATVVSIEDHLVALRFGSGEQERTILAVRGSIIRKTDDGEYDNP